MGLFSKKESSEEDQPPPPPVEDLLAAPNKVSFTIRSPWQWVLERTFAEDGNFTIIDKMDDLPTSKMVAAVNNENGQDSAPSTPASRRRKKKGPVPCTLRVEIQNSEGIVLESVHGTSEAFNGLEDKDELVRTIQRCRCEQDGICPPSRLINWDVTKDECLNVIGKDLPFLKGAESDDGIAVLKEPMGSQGTGVFFVRNAEEIHEIVDEHRKRAVKETNLLDNLIAAKGRIPSWVLQAEVRPCLLIRDRRKFHIRTYVVGVENWDTDDLIELSVYNRHEIRIASEPVPEVDDGNRDRGAHITNGALSKETERGLLHEEPELVNIKLQETLETFVAEAFATHLMKDISHRVGRSANEESNGLAIKFAIAALDIMVTEGGRLFLLEVNVNPAAPPAGAIQDGFQEHLVGFLGDLTKHVLGQPSPNFVTANSILEREGV